MPIYEYKCENCGNRFEAITRITEKEDTECPRCGEMARKLLSTFATAAETKSKPGNGGCYGGG